MNLLQIFSSEKVVIRNGIPVGIYMRGEEYKKLRKFMRNTRIESMNKVQLAFV